MTTVKQNDKYFFGFVQERKKEQVWSGTRESNGKYKNQQSYQLVFVKDLEPQLEEILSPHDF